MRQCQAVPEFKVCRLENSFRGAPRARAQNGSQGVREGFTRRHAQPPAGSALGPAGGAQRADQWGASGRAFFQRANSWRCAQHERLARLAVNDRPQFCSWKLALPTSSDVNEGACALQRSHEKLPEP